MNIKEPQQLEKEILQNSSGSHPIMILDTGGLIDIVAAMRKHNLNHKNSSRDQRYEKTTVFLKSLSEKYPIIITPRTYKEIQEHGRIRINEHNLEIGPKTVDFALDTMISSIGFVSGLEHKIELDQTRYDAYWASTYGCNGNNKKHLEGCSEADKEILSTIACLSTSKIPTIGKEISPVLVISPDKHIILGAELLKRGFEGRYSNIVPISTRH